MSGELKACPHCGGEAYDAHPSGTAWFIGCKHEPDCHHADFQRSEAEAIAAWNRRAPDQSAELVSELVGALERISEMTPGTANAADARALHLTVKAIADEALAKAKAGGA